MTKDVMQKLAAFKEGHRIELRLSPEKNVAEVLWSVSESDALACEDSRNADCRCDEKKLTFEGFDDHHALVKRTFCSHFEGCQRTNCNAEEAVDSPPPIPVYPSGNIHSLNPEWVWTHTSNAPRYQIHLVFPTRDMRCRKIENGTGLFHVIIPPIQVYPSVAAIDKYFEISDGERLCHKGICSYQPGNMVEPAIAVFDNATPRIGSFIQPEADCDDRAFTFAWSVRPIYGRVTASESPQIQFTVQPLKVNCIAKEPHTGVEWAFYLGVQSSLLWPNGTVKDNVLGQLLPFSGGTASEVCNKVGREHLVIRSIRLCKQLYGGATATLINATCPQKQAILNEALRQPH
jgi:hypothetical protein